MRFAVYDTDATALCFVRRLLDEGAEVLYYIEPRFQRKVGENLVPKVESVERLLAWAKEAPSIAFFTCSGAGPQADAFRKAGIPVVGGGTFCDRLEKDRAFGERIAAVCGMKVPETREFPTISAAQAFIESQDGDWYFKTDRYLESDATCGGDRETLCWHLDYLKENHGDRVGNIVQRKIEGVAWSTACWWNGQSFVRPFYATVEHKKFLNDDLGPSTGCAINAIYAYEQETPRLAKELLWDNLEGVFRKQQAPPGSYDINAILADDGAYFLEWCGRLGFDADPTGQRLLDGSLAVMLERLVKGTLDRVPYDTKDLAYGVRLSVSPYPWEATEGMKTTCEGVPIHNADGLWDGNFVAYSVAAKPDGDLYLADRNGLVGIAVSRGRSLKACAAEAQEYATETLHVPALQLRTDGAAVLKKDAEKAKALGYDVHPGMLR